LHARPIGEDDFVDLALRETAPTRHKPLFHHTNHYFWWCWPESRRGRSVPPFPEGAGRAGDRPSRRQGRRHGGIGPSGDV